MILASCRKHFDSNQLFEDDLQFRRYPNLNDTSKFADMTQGEVADEVRDRHVLVLVHGFRNPIKNVASAYGKLETELTRRGMIGPGKYDLALGFLWPGFQTHVGFFAAVPWANRSASFFREFTKLLNSNAHTVDVQTHSLGARVALQAMVFEHEVFVDNLMLTAPAVDNESLEPTKEFSDSRASCRRCLVYHSSKDPVLKVGYRIGALDRALGFKGPEHPKIILKDCPEVFVVDCSAMVTSHGGYRGASEVYDHWEKVLADVPLDRFVTLKKSS
jgi:esterase/lipase superfamily enzyme